MNYLLHWNPKRRARRHIAGACFLGAVTAGIAVAAAQSPTSPRLSGDAPPPASALSLWYRAPASDHPLLPVDAPRQSRQAGTAEWVRALPVGNGRRLRGEKRPQERQTEQES